MGLTMKIQTRKGYTTKSFWVYVLLLALGWCWWVSQGSRLRGVTILGLTLASFAVGSLLGFLFTSYGEESTTVGKIRDWVIGGISGLTFAQVIERESALKKTSRLFHDKRRPQRLRIGRSNSRYLLDSWLFLHVLAARTYPQCRSGTK